MTLFHSAPLLMLIISCLAVSFFTVALHANAEHDRLREEFDHRFPAADRNYELFHPR